MTARLSCAATLTLLLCSCIANPLGGGLVANLYAWDDRANPVYSTLSDFNTDYAGYFDGNIDLSNILQEIPGLETSAGTPYLLEVCDDNCLYLVLFPEYFRLADNGAVLGFGVISDLSTLLYHEVSDLPAPEVKPALDQLAMRLLAGDRTGDDLIDYSDLARLDYARSDRDSGLLVKGLDETLSALAIIGGDSQSVETLMAASSCDGSTGNPGELSKLADIDGDGICNALDEDKDGDLVPNTLDAFEFDPSESKDDDGDGIGNSADRDGTIYFVVTEAVHQALTAELEQFMADVSEDTGTTAVLHIANDSPLELRNALTNAFQEQELEGAFLIGDIPYIIYEHEHLPGYRILSDHPYRTFSCPFRLSEEDPELWISVYGASVLARCLPDIWLSRIKSPQSGDEAMEDLRNYFEKNHRLRYTLADEQRLYFGRATPREYTDDFVPLAADALQNHPLYEPSQVDINQSVSPQDQMNGWLNALASNRDMVWLNVHGWPTGVQFQGLESNELLNFGSAELEGFPIRARVVEMVSCSVGKFTRDDYMAGRILFEGDTLLVKAFTEVTFVSTIAGINDFRYLYRALGLGNSFADTYKYYFSGTPGHYFGDPTIRLRTRALPQNRPKLVVDDEHFTGFFDYSFDFGTVETGDIKEHDLQITNTGTEDLVLNGVWIPGRANANGGVIQSTSGLIFEMPSVKPPVADFNYTLTIAPGDTTPLTFAFNPDANNDKSLPSGTIYTGVFHIFTNDPISPTFRVFVRGRELKND